MRKPHPALLFHMYQLCYLHFSPSVEDQLTGTMLLLILHIDLSEEITLLSRSIHGSQKVPLNFVSLCCSADFIDLLAN